jgi:hypothetical protein
LFPGGDPGQSVVFLLDCSLSMGPSGAFAHARQELLARLARLPAGIRFQVIPYNSQALPLPNNRPEFLPMSPEVLAQVTRLLTAIHPARSTKPFAALKCGLSLHPDVLYLVTDTDEMGTAEVDAVTRLNHGQTVIHAIELTARPGTRPDSPLCRLAASNRGTYRRVPLPS